MWEYLSFIWENKDILWTVVLLLMIGLILYPLIRKWYRQTDKTIDILKKEIVNNKEQFKEMLNIFQTHTEEDARQLTNIFNEIKNHNKNSEKEFNFIKNNMFKTTLDNEQAVRILKTEMWYVTEKKLEFIKDILQNNHIKGREDKIRIKLEVGLEWYSQEYYASFRWYNTKLWDLWDWLDDNFDSNTFKEFCNEIFEIIIAEYKWEKETVITEKVNEIRNVMKRVQNGLANHLRNDLLNK